MDDEREDQQETTRDLTTLGAVFSESVTADLSGLLEREVSFSTPSVEDGERDTFLGNDEWACSVCTSAGDDPKSVYVLLPLPAAFVLAAAQLKKDAADFDAFSSSQFEGEALEAYTGVMDVCVGILGRVLDEEAGLPSLQSGETRTLAGGSNSDALPDGQYRRMRFGFRCGDFPEASFDLLFGASVAADWFGRSTTTSDEAGGAVALVDPCADSRELFASLADELGCDILTLDPAEMAEYSFEELAETSSVILAWDLGGRSGLDFAERLRAYEATANLRIALASESPTRAMVDASLRWGARTVLLKPWDPVEIRDRLL